MFSIPINRIWVALLVATGITYWLGETAATEQLGMVPVLVMLTVSLAKGLWVIYDFMELRHAPRLWRWLVCGWLFFVIAMITVAYWLGLH
jgi:cytochrome c oxidase subunit 4